MERRSCLRCIADVRLPPARRQLLSGCGGPPRRSPARRRRDAARRDVFRRARRAVPIGEVRATRRYPRSVLLRCCVSQNPLKIEDAKGCFTSSSRVFFSLPVRQIALCDLLTYGGCLCSCMCPLTGSAISSTGMLRARPLLEGKSVTTTDAGNAPGGLPAGHGSVSGGDVSSAAPMEFGLDWYSVWAPRPARLAHSITNSSAPPPASVYVDHRAEALGPSMDASASTQPAADCRACDLQVVFEIDSHSADKDSDCVASVLSMHHPINIDGVPEFGPPSIDGKETRNQPLIHLGVPTGPPPADGDDPRDDREHAGADLGVCTEKVIHTDVDAGIAVELPPYFDWLQFVSKPSDAWHYHLSSVGLRISSLFSGICSELRVAEMLIDHLTNLDDVGYKVHHMCTFEISKAARDVIRLASKCPLFGDLCSVLPDDVYAWVKAKPRSVSQMRKLIITDQLMLRTHAYCYRSLSYELISLGDIVISGIPCIDYSSYGRRQGLSGTTGLLIAIWVRLMLIHRPAFIILEEVQPFLQEGIPFLMESDVLGAIYSFSFEMLDPRFFNLPVSRPRLYCILTRLDLWSLNRPLNELRSTLPPFDLCARETTGIDYFYSSEASASPTPAQFRNLREYVKLFGPADNVYDLTQTASKRPRHLLKDRSMPVITKSCRMYSTLHHRFLDGVEALVVQGWPICALLPNYDRRLHHHFKKMTLGTTTSFAGNGMHLGCLGLTLGWILAHGLCHQWSQLGWFHLVQASLPLKRNKKTSHTYRMRMCLLMMIWTHRILTILLTPMGLFAL